MNILLLTEIEWDNHQLALARSLPRTVLILGMEGLPYNWTHKTLNDLLLDRFGVKPEGFDSFNPAHWDMAGDLFHGKQEYFNCAVINATHKRGE